MTEPITAWYLATVWLTNADDDPWSSSRQVIRLPAIGPDDFKARVRSNWPNKTAEFGPVSRSKVQG